MISALPGHIMARFHVPQTAQGDPRAQTAPPWRGSGGGGRGNGELLRETGRGVILGDRLSLLPGSRAGPGGLGSGAAPRDPRPGRCLWSRAGSRGESGGSAARRVRRGGAGSGVPNSRPGSGLIYLLFLYFSHLIFHLALRGPFSRSGGSGKAAPEAIPAGGTAGVLCPPPLWAEGTAGGAGNAGGAPGPGRAGLP